MPEILIHDMYNNHTGDLILHGEALTVPSESIERMMLATVGGGVVFIV